MVVNSMFPLKSSKWRISIFNAPRKHDLLLQHAAKITPQAYIKSSIRRYMRLILSMKRLFHCKTQEPDEQIQQHCHPTLKSEDKENTLPAATRENLKPWVKKRSAFTSFLCTSFFFFFLGVVRGQGGDR